MGAAFLQFADYGFEVSGSDFVEADLAAGHCRSNEIGTRLDAIRNHRVVCAAQAGNPLDPDGTGSGAADAGAHRIQEIREIDDLRFAGGILQQGFALGERCRHHQVLGARNRHGIEHDMGAAQAFRPRADIAVFDDDLRAHRLQPVNVQVDRPGADGAAAGKGYFGLPEARHERSEHEDRSPHRLDQFVRGAPFGDGRRVDLHVELFVEGRPDAHALQQGYRGRHVLQLRHVANGDGLGRQQGAGKYRQRGVFSARHVDPAGQPPATFYKQLVQGSVPVGGLERRPFRRRMGANRHRVYLVAHQAAEALIDELVPRDRPFTLESRRYDERRVMGIVLAVYLDNGPLEPIFDEGLDFLRFHL